MSEPDPFSRLGLGPDATLADVRAARRRLAFDAHPDRGGDAAAMQAINAAFDACVAHLTGRRPLAPPAREGSPPPDPPMRRVDHDVPSFTVDALPAEAFEALVVVTSWIGEVLDDDPPYVLEVHLDDPVRCWCRLDLVPDAGASTVSLTVVADPGGTASAEEVRDRWVELLNKLGPQLP